MQNACIADQIETELREGIFTIRFNRPEKKNALNLAMYAALAEALQAFMERRKPDFTRFN